MKPDCVAQANEHNGCQEERKKAISEKQVAKKLRLPVWLWLLCLLCPLVIPIVLLVLFSRWKTRRLVLRDIEHPDKVWTEKFALKRAKSVGLLEEMQASLDALHARRKSEQEKKEAEVRRKAELALQEQKVVVAGCEWNESRVRIRLDLLEKECDATWWHAGAENAYRNIALVLMSGEKILSAISGRMSLESNSDRIQKEIAVHTQAIAENADFMATSMVVGPGKAAFLSVLGEMVGGAKRNLSDDGARVFVLATDRRLLLFYRPDVGRDEYSFAEIESGKARASLKGDDVLLLDAMVNKIYKVSSVSKGFALKFVEVVNAEVQNSSTSKAGQPEESSPLAQIEKLAAMKDKGILSEEEFQEQKRKFLARM